MSSAALHPCGATGCPELVESGKARCPTHTPKASLGWNKDEQRPRGRQVQRLRQELYAKEPFCRTCHIGLTLRPGALNFMIRDHIVPLAEGGTEDPSNIQPLCQQCSDAKTQAESRRGVSRSRW